MLGMLPSRGILLMHGAAPDAEEYAGCRPLPWKSGPSRAASRVQGFGGL